jgi:predicted enzyme related to lactoylglutathione lyase
MPRVVHFEIYTADPDAVRPFYQDVFGWKFQKFEGGPIDYSLITTGDDKEPGINGGLARPREGQSPGTLNTIGVASLDQSIKKIEQRAGKICAEDGDSGRGLVSLRRRPRRKCIWSHRARYQSKIITPRWKT